MNFSLKSSLLCLSAMLCSLPIHAADRALIVGVGEYRDARANLPGIDLDVAMMRNVAENLGFSKENIKILRDRDATAKGIEQAIDTWLVKGTQKNDRALFYFSGHGTNIPDTNGDEDDGADEVLVAHDVEGFRLAGGEPSLRNVVVDDDFNRWLKRIPSQHVLVLIDACNSGTATKGFSLVGSKAIKLRTRGEPVETKTKSYVYPGMPLASKDFGSLATDTKQFAENFVAISAAQDDEFAQASSRGSIFTMSIEKIVSHSVANNIDLSPKQMLEFSEGFIRQVITEVPGFSPKDLFHPALSGNPALAQKPLRYRAASSGPGPMWQQMETLAKKGQSFALSLNHRDGQYKAEVDTITLKMEFPANVQGYYLNIVTVDNRDNATVLYPNQFSPGNNVISGKTFNFPTQAGNFDFVALPPYGKAMIVALVTRKPLNLYTEGSGNIDDQKQYLIDDAFASVSVSGLEGAKAAGVRAKAKDLYSAKVIFNTVR